MDLRPILWFSSVSCGLSIVPSFTFLLNPSDSSSKGFRNSPHIVILSGTHSTTLMDEQSNPWDPFLPQDVMSRHRGVEPFHRSVLLRMTNLLSLESPRYYILCFPIPSSWNSLLCPIGTLDHYFNKK